MNGENSDLQKHFIELAQRHSLSLGEPALPAEFTRKPRCEYVGHAFGMEWIFLRQSRKACRCLLDL